MEEEQNGVREIGVEGAGERRKGDMKVVGGGHEGMET